MIKTRIQQQDDTFFAVIPDEDMARYGLVEGDSITVALHKIVDGRILPAAESPEISDGTPKDQQDEVNPFPDR